ncbi:GxxExxY protein [Propionivibrio limicola]|uniref:GxxExxY protein n=1 Tax=Propionivibrio limicola TaxID=167645 RepID=UPI0012914974|nr:GxxExxY protein [Propionivibrio limicola]
MEENVLSGNVIGAAIEVHRVLGPGLLESAYELALERELAMQGLRVERQKPVPLAYKGAALGDGFRIDLLANDRLIVEIKAVERIQPIHEAQLLTYLRLTGKSIGLLINFNERILKSGVKRVANGL